MTTPITPQLPSAAAAAELGAHEGTTSTVVEEPTPTEMFRRQANPRPGFVFFVVFAMVGAGAAQMSAALLTLTLKATELSADAATTTISISSGIAGILTLFALPIIGSLSDRSRSRHGRRRPFLIAGAASFALGGVLLGIAPNIWVFVAGHLFITLGFVAAGVVTIALIADQLPANRRGPASAFVSLGTPMGALLGTVVALPFGADLGPLIGIPTAVAVIAMVLLAIVVRDPQFTHRRDTRSIREVVGIFWVNPLKFPSFTAVFTSRMLVFSGVAALNGYQAIYLLMNIGLAPAELGSAILLTVVVNTGVSLAVAPAIGKLSDRLGVRKPFILVAAVILGLGLIFASMAPNFGVYLIACGVVALGQGVYFAVELALATSVVPDPDNPAKDLAIIKIADNLPVSIVSAVAPALLAVGVGASGGQNFSVLFIAGAASAILGGLAILFVRAAR
ncbi:MFS family permease [Okibacterium sp. HSC-33S16]|uniref:MFS transporter n=1 Tax=Okibacterium sp. HSC-33S16 TaxID=2910965 RepID=UPI00209EC0A8|nr:MFS transporter [Okibacterium sp. HSC-33S16]MCP2031094.1 MFS family permease [Okibacterium sp. HSC-33S16]